jgi:hypothetical protein
MKIVLVRTGTPEEIHELLQIQLAMQEPLDADPCSYYGSVVAAKSFVADRREVHLLRDGATRFKLVLGDGPQPMSYEDRWCYDSFGAAWAAFEKWDGSTDEPAGWTMHPPTGRRRPRGIAAKEYIQW